MQVGFINNLRKIYEAGEDKALLISATGTGKTYASAFAARELEFKRVLFLVHRNQIAKQALKSLFFAVHLITVIIKELNCILTICLKEDVFIISPPFCIR